MNLPTHRAPTHPGHLLEDEFVKPLGLSHTDLAKRLHVSFKTVSALCNGRQALSPEMALRLSRLFGTTAEFWMNLQASFDLWRESHGRKANELATIKPMRVARAS